MSERRKEILSKAIHEYLLKIIKLRLEPEIKNTPLSSDLAEHLYSAKIVLNDLEGPDIGLYTMRRNKDLCEAAMSNYLERLKTIRQNGTSVIRNNPMHYLDEEIDAVKSLMNTSGNS